MTTTTPTPRLCPLCGERRPDGLVCEDDGHALIEDLSGARIRDWYTLTALAGVGAQGSTVWEADGPDGVVAVKLIDVKPGQALEPVLDRIVTQQSDDCPACLRAIDTGLWRGRVYVVSPLLDIDALSDHLLPQPDEAQALRLGRAMLRALMPLHAAGRAHGNLHPANIFIDESADPIAVRFLDGGQGAACFWSRDPDDPMTLESVHVFAPEQLAADEFGPPTDVYQIAALIYRLATGRPVFDTTDVEHLKRLKMTVEPDLPHLDDSPGLRAVLARALSPRFAHRHAHAKALLSALKPPLDAPVVAHPPTAPLLPMPPQRATSQPFGSPSAPPPPPPPPEAPAPEVAPAPASAPAYDLDPPGAMDFDEERPRRGLVWLVLALLALGGGFWYLQDQAATPTAKAPPEPTETAQKVARLRAAAEQRAKAGLKATPGRDDRVTPTEVPETASTASTASTAPTSAPERAAPDPSPALDRAAASAPPSEPPRAPVVIESTPPGAAVTLNGEYAGRTPWRSQLADGAYAVALSLPQYVDKTIDLRIAGEPVDLKTQLVRKQPPPRLARRATTSPARSRRAATKRAAKPADKPLVAAAAPPAVKLLGGAPTVAKAPGVKLLGDAPSAPQAGVKLLDEAAAPPPAGTSSIKLLGQ